MKVSGARLLPNGSVTGLRGPKVSLISSHSSNISKPESWVILNVEEIPVNFLLD
jgi:hypothetical protein